MKKVMVNHFLIKKIEKIKETSGIFIGDFGDSVLDFGELTEEALYIANPVLGIEYTLPKGTIIAYNKNCCKSISDDEAIVELSQIVYYEEPESNE